MNMKINTNICALGLAAMLLSGLVACKKNEIVSSVVVDGVKPTTAFTNTTGSLVITFTNTSQNGDSYYWQFGDGTNSTEKSPVHTYASPGKYNVILKVNSAAGYSTTSTKVVPASVPAVADFTLASNFETNGVFSNTSLAADAVVWDFGDNTATSTDLNPTHKFPAYGDYTVKLTVTGLLGDVSVKSKVVSVANTNLLKGGGFNAGDGTFWQTWSSQASIPPDFGYTTDKPAGGYDGCLRFKSFTNSAGLNHLIYQSVQVVAGKKYSLSAVVKAPAGGKNNYLQFYISKDANTWVESSAADANFFLALNNYHAWGATSSSTTAVNGDLYKAVVANGSYGLGVATAGVYTATTTGTLYIGIQCGVYAGTSNGDILIDNLNFVPLN